MIHRATVLRASSLVVVLMLAAGCESMSIGNPSINVLKQVEPARDAVNGRWVLDRRSLQSEATPRARLRLPVIPHGDYRLSVTFSRPVGSGTANLILPVGGRQVMLVLDAPTMDGTYSGLELIDGNAALGNTTADREFRLVNNRTYRLDATVRTQVGDARIDIDIDQRPLVRWLGPISALSLSTDWDLGDPAASGLGASDGVIQVRAVQLRMLPGETTTSWN